MINDLTLLVILDHQQTYEAAIMSAINEINRETAEGQNSSTIRSESFISTASKLLEKVKQQQQQMRNLENESTSTPKSSVKSASYRPFNELGKKPNSSLSNNTAAQQLSNANSIKIK